MSGFIGSVILINTVVALFYFLFQFSKKREKAMCLAILYLLVPVLGFLIVVLSKIVCRLSRDDFDKSSLMVRRTVENFDSKPDIKRELDIVSINESLAVSTQEDKRALVLNVLKKDIELYSKSAHVALDDEDSEVTHYAASAIMEVQRKLILRLQEIESVCQKNPNDTDSKKIFAECLFNYISSDMLSKKDRMINIYKYLKTVEQLYQLDKNLVTNEDIVRQIEFFMELGNFYEAEKWAHIALDGFESEITYLTTLKMYYSLSNKKAFYEVIGKMKASNISFTNKGVETIRFWCKEKEE